MRKLIVLGVGSALVAGAAFLVPASRPAITAQEPAAPRDSATAYILAASDTAQLKGPRQPIFFRHDIHAGQYKISCQYCHYSVSPSSEPVIPSVQTCMGCHRVVSGAATDTAGRAEIAKIRAAANSGEPVEWVRIHTLAKHAHFPHMRHIKAMGPNACATCHGDVARMPQVYKVNNVNNMGWCISCHVERNVSRDCSVCHY
jgi:hypothetical protein